MDTVNREEYRHTPKEGFVLTHFLTVADVKRSAEFYLEFLEEKLFATVNPPSSKLPTAG